MVDPFNVTNFNRDDKDLHEFFVFSVCVAGKTAKTIAPAVANLYNLLLGGESYPPFGMRFLTLLNLYTEEEIRDSLLRVGIGCYAAKAKCLKIAATRWKTVVRSERVFDPRNCTVEDLESIHGIGAKTARYFILHSRIGVDVAVIDRHMLKHLVKHGVKNVPKTTPPKGENYRRLELEILSLAYKAKMSPADYDLMVWKEYARR